jgi:hypothetical protein
MTINAVIHLVVDSINASGDRREKTVMMDISGWNNPLTLL